MPCRWTRGPLWLKTSETFSNALWFTVKMLIHISHNTHLLTQEERFPTHTLRFGIAGWIPSRPERYRNRAERWHLKQTCFGYSVIRANKTGQRFSDMSEKTKHPKICMILILCFHVVWKNLCTTFRKCFDWAALHGNIK